MLMTSTAPFRSRFSHRQRERPATMKLSMLRVLLLTEKRRATTTDRPSDCTRRKHDVGVDGGARRRAPPRSSSNICIRTADVTRRRRRRHRHRRHRRHRLHRRQIANRNRARKKTTEMTHGSGYIVWAGVGRGRG